MSERTFLSVNVSLRLGDDPQVKKHCDHEDGTTSLVVSHSDGFLDLYVNGTAAQIHAFGTALIEVADRLDASTLGDALGSTDEDEDDEATQ